MNNQPILVTKPYLPDKAEYQKYLDQIWEANYLTNNGPLVRELENKLKTYLGVKHLFFVSNGTIAMQLAIKALGLTQEIITTPYTYVASTSAILWENCTPVFSDIENRSYCLDPENIEAHITEKTQAILAVHVYGIPCQVQKINEIAQKHNLKVIYDAAHAFGVMYENQSVLNYGDISTLSFHATKLFHTGEGGAIITNNDTLAEKLSLMRSFGYINDDYFLPGINAKNSEFHAAMGLCNLPNVPAIIEKRKTISETYDSGFRDLMQTQKITRPFIPESTFYNYAYYPVIFASETDMNKVKTQLEAINIFPRRYFYPSLNTLPYVTHVSCPVSESVASRVLCLPFYHTIDQDTVETIITTVRAALMS